MTATHRALVRRAPDRRGRTLVDVARVPTPALADGDLLVAPVIAGVCGTDWQILRGDRSDPAATPGHEGVARVIAGDGAFAAGDLVTVNPTHPTDPGFLLGHNVPGFWSERTLVPASAVAAGLVLPVAPSLPDPAPVGALAEPLASAMYGLEIALSIARPRSLVVWGTASWGDSPRSSGPASCATSGCCRCRDPAPTTPDSTHGCVVFPAPWRPCSSRRGR